MPDAGIMTSREKLQDPLKSLDQICEPDERQASFVGTLEDNHAELNSIILNEAVPIDVRQLFETAKNLSLYSWFVYRFHQVSELIAFAALEMALRDRYLAENPVDEKSKKKRPPSLYDLMQHAKKEKWLNNEDFPSLYARAKHHAQHIKMMEKIKSHDFEKDPSIPVDEPTEGDIKEALESLDMVEAVTSNAHRIRNDLAHGSKTLHPNSIWTLQTTAEVINQIYP